MGRASANTIFLTRWRDGKIFVVPPGAAPTLPGRVFPSIRAGRAFAHPARDEDAARLAELRDAGGELVNLVAMALFVAFFAVVLSVLMPECFGQWVCQ